MNTKSSSASVRKQSKFVRFIKGPIRMLARVREFYLHSFTGCASQVAYAGATLHSANLPRSFSTNSTHDSNYRCGDQDMKELIRIASAGSRNGTLPAGGRGAAAMKRSRTVAIGRIDEETPCDFGGKHVAGLPAGVLRSGSCVAGGGTKMV
ncbi:hypothetical protein STAS_09217 [Striga asiatica]|uniref:Uncharacterized protein n=1 Tax=Striga asiatica TaxID=4170 RepID=A0A5A7PKF2_STRAF|nr:hypothetical protein STAS_09217 [Striga asiatica]